ncbi:MAG: ribosome maturation factor RimP, partial [Acidimicrobiales bacterium]|nr:ribosome maturation factor RimP [Acidimicrobiales bacterium]
MELATQVRRVVEAALATSDLELWDVETHPGLVRVVVDRPGGVDLDTLSSVNRLVSESLDREDPMPAGRYQLEVSSPGVERPLRTPGHFQRSLGTTVSVKTRPGTPGARRLEGRLVAADDDGIVVAPEGDRPNGQEVDASVGIPYQDIERARTVLCWGPAASGVT